MFILKRLSDSFGYKSFDYSRLHGDVSRIILGGALGVVVVAALVPDPSKGSELKAGDVSLAVPIVAFLAGLGVKAVYGAFEELVDSISARLSGKGAKNAPAPKASAAAGAGAGAAGGKA